MYKTIYITGYKSYELNIYKDDMPEVQYIRKFIEHKLVPLIEEGLEWVLIQGQIGIELWAAEVVVAMKKTYPQIKLGIVTPFENHTERWNESNKLKYVKLAEQADFVDSVFHQPYEGPYQFQRADQFMLDHTDFTLLFYDEEREASPKYFKSKLFDFMDKTNYTCDIVTMDELSEFVNDLQSSEVGFLDG
ncbi:DUF1273 domain-containing protein [Staphylococcus sp. SQ8-PEA]|uniref:UPF0398 protein N9R04_02040 n=1 Tax=Staphylococcus marylandisciuri TaxID=2981529 RepID=A0ABT2QNE6_9STAP|nr:DUF1273 domain-containing protein [Staphylococcus marylandisciuri]MCU5745503.1 DUF1273 domain-containing protein [Staphylococcus marylandisciuri]